MLHINKYIYIYQLISIQRKVPKCLWTYSSLNQWAHLINSKLVAMLLAMASIAQLAEHHTRFVGSWVQFPARRPKLHFCNRSQLGLKKFKVYGHLIFPSSVFVNLYIYIYIYTKGEDQKGCSVGLKMKSTQYHTSRANKEVK